MKIKPLKSKKAQFQSFLPYMLMGMIIVIIFAIVVIPTSDMFDRVADELKDNEEINDSEKAVSSINTVQGLITPAFDQLVFILLSAIILGTIIISIFTDYHPVIIVVMILSIILLVIVAGLMSNAYDDVTSEDLLKNKSSEFTLTNAVMGTQFPIIIAVVGVISILILLSKRGRQSQPV